MHISGKKGEEVKRASRSIFFNQICQLNINYRRRNKDLLNRAIKNHCLSPVKLVAMFRKQILTRRTHPNGGTLKTT